MMTLETKDALPSRRQGNFTRATYSLLTLFLAAASSPGAILYESAGFELPRFTASQPLQGQDNPPTGQGPWLKDSGTSTATVQTAVVAGGLQAVQVTRLPISTGDTRWSVIEPFTPTALENIVQIDVDMRVEQSTFTPFDFGPAFGIEAYDGSAAGAPKLIGSVTLDARTGDVLYQQTGTGVLTETGTVIARGTFHRYSLIANFTTKRYSVLVDGGLLRTEPFVDNAVTFTDAPIATFAATAASAGTASGTAYFDNYTITTIPEPGNVALLLGGWVLVAASRFSRCSSRCSSRESRGRHSGNQEESLLIKAIRFPR